MLLTCQKSCERLAKGEIRKVGLEKKHSFEERVVSFSLLTDDRFGSNHSFHRDLACQLNDVFHTVF